MFWFWVLDLLTTLRLGLLISCKVWSQDECWKDSRKELARSLLRSWCPRVLFCRVFLAFDCFWSVLIAGSDGCIIIEFWVVPC